VTELIDQDLAARVLDRAGDLADGPPAGADLEPDGH